VKGDDDDNRLGAKVCTWCQTPCTKMEPRNKGCVAAGGKKVVRQFVCCLGAPSFHWGGFRFLERNILYLFCITRFQNALVRRRGTGTLDETETAASLLSIYSLDFVSVGELCGVLRALLTRANGLGVEFSPLAPTRKRQ